MNGEQKKYLLEAYDLEPQELERLLGDLGAFMGQTYPDWVRSRHQELQGQGLANDISYKQIKEELSQRLFCAPVLSLRQIRRLIYG